MLFDALFEYLVRGGPGGGGGENKRPAAALVRRGLGSVRRCKTVWGLPPPPPPSPMPPHGFRPDV